MASSSLFWDEPKVGTIPTKTNQTSIQSSKLRQPIQHPQPSGPRSHLQHSSGQTTLSEQGTGLRPQKAWQRQMRFPAVKRVSIPKPNIPVAGRLRHFLSKWYELTSDPEIIDLITGLHIDITTNIQQDRMPPELHFSQEEQIAIDNQIADLLQKKAIVPCAHISGEFISNVFVQPKKGWRLPNNFKLKRI